MSSESWEKVRLLDREEDVDGCVRPYLQIDSCTRLGTRPVSLNVHYSSAQNESVAKACYWMRSNDCWTGSSWSVTWTEMVRVFFPKRDTYPSFCSSTDGSQSMVTTLLNVLSLRWRRSMQQCRRDEAWVSCLSFRLEVTAEASVFRVH